jgi:hypothetical protein
MATQMAAAVAGRSCPFCQAVMKPGEALVECNQCHTIHHEECWQEAGGCTTLGCSDATPSAPASVVSAQRRTSACAIWSLVLGILGLSLPAVICGHMGLSRIKRANGFLEGKGLAIAGLVLGYVALAITFLLVALAIPVVKSTSKRAEVMATHVSISALSTAVSMYQMDFGRLPPNLESLSDASNPRGYVYMNGAARDSWGNRFRYHQEANGNGFVITSSGPDKIFDTADDIVKSSL